MPADDADGFTSLRKGSTDAKAVQEYYDAWSETYDATLNDWDYRAPQDACDLIEARLPDNARILDVGCGTGLMGAALQERGTFKVDGVDISARSLSVALKRGCYDRLVQHDLQRLPLPFGDDMFDAAVSVGVLTYVEHAEALMRDLCRTVRPRGIVAFTQRDDLWDARDFSGMLSRLENDGLWHVDTVTEPRDYLPENDEFGAEIKVIHTVCTVV